MKIRLFILVVILLLISCKEYKSEPYDKWESKLRNEMFPSKLEDLVIKPNWQQYDPKSYLRFTNVERVAIVADSIPPWLNLFPKLRWIATWRSDTVKPIQYLPEYIGRIANLDYLSLSDMEIQTIPESFKNLKRLRVLELSGNNLNHVPEILIELDSLVALSLDNNNISEIPEFICQLKDLRSLILSKNNISELPECIGELKQLDFLSLHNNQLTELPESISDLPLLENLSIGGNPISSLPEGLFDKPNRLTSIWIEDTSALRKDTLLMRCIKELERRNIRAQVEERRKSK